MYGITEFFSHAFSSLSSFSTDLLITFAFGGFAAVFLVALIGTLCSRRLKRADKRPFLRFVNLFTAVVLSVFLTGFPLASSVMAAALFWCVGYLAYGLLCVLSKPKEKNCGRRGNTVGAMPCAVPVRSLPPEVPAAKNSVRLEHALSIADRLLLKNLGRSDRMELEKMKTALSVLQVKGTLSPQESETLNENFNALLKLMAKYNL